MEAVPHISWGKAISLLFCDQQDFESEWWEMKTVVFGPIFTHKKIPKSM